MGKDGKKGIAIVHSPTRLEGLRRRWGTLGQAKFLLQQAHLHQDDTARRKSEGTNSVDSIKSTGGSDADFDEYQSEAIIYQESLHRVKETLESLELTVRLVERSFVPNFDFRSTECIVVVGQDGLVANVAKYAGEIPIVAVNPDPSRIDGILLPFGSQDALEATKSALSGRARLKQVTLAKVTLQDGQSLLAFNDFFIGARSHVSARYVLRSREGAEPQSSSGVIVSTGAGSTGWLSSLFNFLTGVGKQSGIPPVPCPKLDWSSSELVWLVREPFISRRSKADLVFGRLGPNDQLILESLMPDQGVIFSDGIESDFLAFNSGAIASIGIAPTKASLVIR